MPTLSLDFTKKLLLTITYHNKTPDDYIMLVSLAEKLNIPADDVELNVELMWHITSLGEMGHIVAGYDRNARLYGYERSYNGPVISDVPLFITIHGAGLLECLENERLMNILSGRAQLFTGISDLKQIPALTIKAFSEFSLLGNILDYGLE